MTDTKLTEDGIRTLADSDREYMNYMSGGRKPSDPYALNADSARWLKDKLKSWPREMALNCGDIRALLHLLDQHKPAPEEPTSGEREEMVKWLDDRLGLIYMQLPQLPECPGYWESLYEDEIEPLEKIRSLILSAPRKVSRVPYKCPVCDGSGQTIQQTIGAGTAAEYPGFLPCPACSGSGIVWNEPIAALPGGEK